MGSDFEEWKALLEQQIKTVEQGIKDVEQEIKGAEQEIKGVRQQIVRAYEELVKTAPDARDDLRKMLEWLQNNEKESLNKEKELRNKEERFRTNKTKLLNSVERLRNEIAHALKASGIPKIDNTLSIRKEIVERCVPLCNVDELRGLLKAGFEDSLRFPVTLDMWNALPTKRDKLFKLARPDEVCYEIGPLVKAIVDPPMPIPTADTEASFIHFWDTVIEEPLKFFYDGPCLSERDKSGEGSVSGTRPDKVVRFGFRFCALWRGEENGPNSTGDPRQELISKLDWTYKHLPFLLAYHARGALVTFCALHVVVDPFRRSKKVCEDLIQFNISRAEDRLELVLACITVAKLLKTMEAVCEVKGEVSDLPLIRRDSGKVIRPCGRKVDKSYPDDAFYMRVKAIYEATSSCPNVERLLHRRDSDRTIVVQKALVAKPNNNGELVDCIRCLCVALQWLHGEGFMHRDIRWENVLRDRDNAGKWLLVDLDEAIRTDECFDPHPLRGDSHAPEMTVGPHDTMVDIWGIGHLLRTSNILLDSKLSSLMEECLRQVPDRRPTAAECLKLLDM